MAGAGASNSEPQKTILRYVLNASNPKITLDAFPWKTSESPFVVYRGQSFTPKMKSSQTEEAKRAPEERDPLAIQTTRPRPLSTSSVLRDHIVKFAAGWDADPPSGRMFRITVAPGVRFVNLPEEMKTMNLDPSSFEFLKEELREQSTLLTPGTEPYEDLLDYAAKSTTGFQGAFFSTVKRENEVLIDLRGTEIVASGPPEDDTYAVYSTRYKRDGEGKYVLNARGEKVREEYNTGDRKPIQVYPILIRLQGRTGGSRGRTFRRKPKRRDKNGGRPTRKSKPRRHK